MELITATGLSFKYDNSINGIYNVDFSIKKGETVLVSGDSGSGKSTLLKCLNKLIPEIIEGNLTGSLYINGENYSHLKIHEISRKIGSVFQNPRSQFFTTNSTAELVFPMENYGFKKSEMDFILDKTVNELGLTALLNRNIFELSSGERQLLAIASSLVLNQEVLLFDEPSANLDYVNTLKLAKLIKKLKVAGVTIIIADHRFYYLKDMIDKVLLFQSGNLTVFNSEESFRNSDYNTRSFDLFSIDTPIPVSVPGREIARLSNVNFKNVLKNVSLTLRTGEVTVLVGENGVGKTTLARLLCKSIKPDSGNIDIEDLPFFIMQDPDFQLFGTSVFAELELVNPDKNKIAYCLKYLDLYDYRNSHPFDLSGGQKQRLQIAMAMLCDKNLIIFDEPTGGLDSKSMKKVADEILNLKKSKAILVISHDYEFIRNMANRIVYLKNSYVQDNFNLSEDTLERLNHIFNSKF